MNSLDVLEDAEQREKGDVLFRGTLRVESEDWLSEGGRDILIKELHRRRAYPRKDLANLLKNYDVRVIVQGTLFANPRYDFNENAYGKLSNANFDPTHGDERGGNLYIQSYNE